MSAAEKDVKDDTEKAEPSLRESIIAARDEVVARQESEAPKTREKPDAGEQRSTAARDERGRFAAQVGGDARETEGAGRTESPAPSAVQTGAAGGEAPAEAAASLAAAPAAWPAEMRGEWPKVPPTVQAFLHKREAEINRGLSSLDTERAFGREAQRMINPYMPLINTEGGKPLEAIANMLNTAHVLRYSDMPTRAQAVAAIMQRFNIDPRAVFSLYGGQQSQQQQMDPRVAALQQRLQQLEGHLSAQQQAALDAQQEAANAQVADLERDVKTYPHFSAVRADMAQLIGAGVVATLAEAYDRAVWGRPDLRATLITGQSEEQRKATERQQAAAKARTKGASIRGGPGANPPPSKNPNSTVREDILAARDEVLGERRV
jgi:hypothetical protein